MIYCVEDDEGIRNMMTYTLRVSGFAAEGFADGEAFAAAVQRELPTLVILDIMLPGTDGLTILRAFRACAETEAIPVILATAKGTEYDKVQGLDLGADDYLAKPFGMMEMIARVKALLRRAQPVELTRLTYGGICLCPEAHTVTVSDVPVTLTLKEYELLLLFVQHPLTVYTRDQLLATVWGYEYESETRTVDVHIRNLRTKLGDYGEWIETVRGIGYRMGQPR